MSIFYYISVIFKIQKRKLNMKNIILIIFFPYLNTLGPISGLLKFIKSKITREKLEFNRTPKS